MAVTGISCTQPSIEECCDRHDMNFAKWFCYAICVLCCMECTITYDGDDKAGWGGNKPKPPVQDAVRDYPTIVPIGNGLSFTTSEYGLFIPIVFGTDKLNGNVFWSSGFETDFITVEDKIYQYARTSFALGICEGEIDALLRLWVGERLIIDNTMQVDENGFPTPTGDGFILGATIDLTDPDSPLRNISEGARSTRITVFTGSETQVPEGVIVDEEGYSNTPAYRGLAYILFENFILGDSSVPNIFVEVAANSNPLFPRIFSNFTTPIDKFNLPEASTLAYDPSFDHFIVGGRDNNGTGSIPNGRGIVTFSGNNLSQVAQHELVVSQGMKPNTLIAPYSPFVLSTGKVLFTGELKTDIYIVNPFTGVLEASYDLKDYSPYRLQIMRDVSLFYGTPPGSLPQDILLVKVLQDITKPGVASLYGYILLAIDSNNQIKVLKEFVDIPSHQYFSTCPIQITKKFAETKPTFGDGTPTEGRHIFGFEGTTVSAAAIRVYRTSFANGSLRDPVTTLFDNIPAEKFYGAGRPVDYHELFVDPTDNCIILCLSSAGFTDMIAKYDPYTREVVWKTPCDFWDNANLRNSNRQLIVGSKFCFMNSSGRVQSCDLKTGTVETIINALATQQLPLPYGNNFQAPFYNGLENSMTYITNQSDKKLVKVFLERTSRTSVPVADIVTKLLQRVGVNIFDMDVEDLSALSLQGYTINSVSSLRSIFTTLSQVFRFDVVESNGMFVYKTRGENALVTIPHKHLADVDENGHLVENQENEFWRSRKINLTYKDIDREYGQNVQSVFFPKYTNTKLDDDMAIDVTVPIVLDADTAKKLAEILLYSKIIYERTYEGVLRPEYGYLDPGDVVTLDLADGPIDVRLRQMDRGDDRTIQFRATQEDPDIYNDQVNLFGNVGRFEETAIPPPDVRVDPFVLDIPFRNYAEAAETSSQYFMFLTLLNQRVATPPVRDLSVNVGGQRVLSVPSPITFPTWGFTSNALPIKYGFYSTDYKNEVRVKLSSASGATLSSVTKETLMTIGVTCNLAYVGGELIQFETATQESDGTWVLRNLHRCRLGTESKALSHVTGERFILLAGADGILDETSIVRVSIDKALGPRTVLEITVNNNNPFQPTPVLGFTGLNLRPRIVTSFKAAVSGGDLVLTWKRRNRYNGQYIEGAPEALPPLEVPEQYRLYLYTDPNTFNLNNPASYLRSETLSSSEYIYSDAMATEDGIDINSATLYCLIAQSGTAAGFDEGAALQFKCVRKAAA